MIAYTVSKEDETRFACAIMKAATIGERATIPCGFHYADVFEGLVALVGAQVMAKIARGNGFLYRIAWRARVLN